MPAQNLHDKILPFPNAKTVIVDRNRRVLAPQAAKLIGCRVDTLRKRLREWRLKGRTVVTLDELLVGSITLDTRWYGDYIPELSSKEHDESPMMTTKRIPPSKGLKSPQEVPPEPKPRGRKPAAGPKSATRAAPPNLAKLPASFTRRPAPAKARTAVPPTLSQVDPGVRQHAAAGSTTRKPGSATQEVNLPYGKTAPIPIRIATSVRSRLQSKAERTGVPMQELIRRSISHMLRTYKLDQVPDPSEPE